MGIVTLIVSLLLLFVPCPSGEAVVDRIVAVVNQEAIMLSELERAMAPLVAEIDVEDRLEREQRVREIQRKVLDQLIEERLIEEETRKVGIKVSEKEIESAIDNIRQRHGFADEDLKRFLEREGFSFEDFKRQIEKQIKHARLISWSIKVDSKVEEKELRTFYESKIDRYGMGETYRPAHILFRIPKGASAGEIRELRRKCEEVLNRIRAGADFGEMALIYSEDISAKDGGDLGYFKRGDLLPAFENEALRLKVGEVGGIVRTDYGFHIIKLLDRKGGAPLSFEEVKEKVLSDYLQEQREKAFERFIASLKEKAIIEIRL